MAAPFARKKDRKQSQAGAQHMWTASVTRTCLCEGTAERPRPGLLGAPPGD